MAAAEDVSGALRAVWEVRCAEARRQGRLTGWVNVIFGVMSATLFLLYGAADALGVGDAPWARWLWLPPLLGAYTALAFATRRVLRLPRPSLPWGDGALGTGLFAALFAGLALAVRAGLVADLHAGMSLVIGSFYVVLGVAFARQRVPALFGLGVVAGALLLLALHAGLLVTTLFGVGVTSAGMVAMGLWLVRNANRLETAPPGELQGVRETLAELRGHEARVAAQDRAARLAFLAALLGLGGVIVMSRGDAMGALLLALAGLVALGTLAVRRAHAG